MATDALLPERVAQARRWFRGKGYPARTADGVTAVVTPEHPDTWDANWIAAGPDVDGAAVGYGMTARCPNGLGLIESLFILPAHRGRGLMSAFIVETARRLGDEGCADMFLDAHADDTPKQLYARLGFAPVALNRTWVRNTAR